MDKESEKKSTLSKGETLTDYVLERAKALGIKMVRTELPKNYVSVIFSRRPLHIPTKPSPTADTSVPPEKDSSEEEV